MRYKYLWNGLDINRKLIEFFWNTHWGFMNTDMEGGKLNPLLSLSLWIWIGEKFNFVTKFFPFWKERSKRNNKFPFLSKIDGTLFLPHTSSKTNLDHLLHSLPSTLTIGIGHPMVSVFGVLSMTSQHWFGVVLVSSKTDIYTCGLYQTSTLINMTLPGCYDRGNISFIWIILALY